MGRGLPPTTTRARRWVLISIAVAAVAAPLYLVATFVATRLPFGAGELADLPTPALEDALPALAQQVARAHDAAAAAPTAVRPNARYCMVLHVYEQYAMANACYSRLRRLAPEDFRWPYLLGVVQEQQNRSGAAAESYRIALGQADWFYPAKVNLARLLLAFGESESAGKLYGELVAGRSGAGIVQFAVGHWHANEGRTARAIEFLERAVGVEPEYSAAHYSLAMSYREAGDVARARRHLALHQRYLGVPPPVDPILAAVLRNDRSARRRFENAQELANGGEPLEAIAEYEAVLAMDPGNARAHANLITVCARLGDLARARTHYRQAIELRPDWEKAHYLLGRALLEAGEPGDAIELLSRAVARDPFFDDAHVLLGVAHEEVGRRNDAIGHYRRALEVAPGYRAAHLYLGTLLGRIGQAEESAYHFERLLEIDDERTALFRESVAQFYLENHDVHFAIEHLRQGEASARLHGTTVLAERLQRTRERLERKAGGAR